MKHEMKIKTFVSFSSTHWDKEQEQSLMDFGLWTCSYSSFFHLSLFFSFDWKSLWQQKHLNTSQWRQKHQKYQTLSEEQKNDQWTWLWNGLGSFISLYALIKLKTSSSLMNAWWCVPCIACRFHVKIVFLGK